uniref:Uncharacterized protein n=1 Tax=Tanacetum cinerariifolium TaxID=118510 RepID=A0A6L2L7T6_TANCI|nr:hypothetical protein [Tanacetum cinerariifolium]
MCNIVPKSYSFKQDKIAQTLEIIKLKKRVKKLERQRRSKSSGLKRLRKVGTSQRVESSAKTVVGAQEDASKQGERIEAIKADEDVTLVDVETQADLGAELQGRKDEDNADIKDASAAEPAIFDDEEMAKRLHDEEIKQAAAREKQENDDLEKAKVLQKQKYQSLKRKPISIAQSRKNMIVYLKNMVGYKMKHFKGMTYDKESFKKLKAVEVSGSHSTQDTLTHDPKEMSEEDVKNMLEIIPVSEFKVEALQVKYPLIDWEIHYEGSRTYWKIIRVGRITQAYQSFEDMLKDFDREDLDVL